MKKEKEKLIGQAFYFFVVMWPSLCGSMVVVIHFLSDKKCTLILELQKVRNVPANKFQSQTMVHPECTYRLDDPARGMKDHIVKKKIQYSTFSENGNIR